MATFRAVRIDGAAYVFDPEARTYCCSLTPSLWLEAAYCDCDLNTVDAACECYPDAHYRGTEVLDLPFVEIDADTLEDALEYVQGNWVV